MTDFKQCQRHWCQCLPFTDGRLRKTLIKLTTPSVENADVNRLDVSTRGVGATVKYWSQVTVTWLHVVLTGKKNC